MRDAVLARTVYKPENFTWQELVVQNGTLSIGPDLQPKIPATCNYWPVGAIDLRYHDDTYFKDFIAQLFRSEALGQRGSTKFGTMELRWIPPAKLAPWWEAQGVYKITNPEDCAKAANAQPEKNYADLLSISGYPELLRLATLFRNEATEPSESQTVQPQKPILYRSAEPMTEVTVESEPIRFTGEIIRAQAHREAQDCMTRVEARTQPINRPTPAKYRVVLRTLDSYWGKDSWRDTSYEDYQLVNYEPDPGNPGFLRLTVAHGSIEIANRPLIAEWTSSPSQGSIQRDGSIEMDAITFDWWVPVPNQSIVGGAPIHPPLGGLLNHINLRLRLGPTIPELTWPSPSTQPNGQRRDLRRQTIHIRYQLDWTADRLQLTIWNQPADRSYIVFLSLKNKCRHRVTFSTRRLPCLSMGFSPMCRRNFSMTICSTSAYCKNNCKPHPEAHPHSG
jgi:hypothetical protein